MTGRPAVANACLFVDGMGDEQEFAEAAQGDLEKTQ